jgi:hypothetical protein
MSDKAACWACGDPDARYTIRVADRDNPGDPSFAVTLCIECRGVVEALLNRIRAAQFTINRLAG